MFFHIINNPEGDAGQLLRKTQNITTLEAKWCVEGRQVQSQAQK